MMPSYIRTLLERSNDSLYLDPSIFQPGVLVIFTGPAVFLMHWYTVNPDQAVWQEVYTTNKQFRGHRNHNPLLADREGNSIFFHEFPIAKPKYCDNTNGLITPYPEEAHMGRRSKEY